MLDGARVVITGAAGFIGSHLAERLAARNTVVAFDRRAEPDTGNLAAVKGRIEYVRGDVRAPEDLARAVRGADVVFHLAAISAVPESFRDPIATNEVNVHGTLAVLRAAKVASVRRVVFASSAAVYGARPPPLPEDASFDLMSPYAVSKAAGELWCHLYHDLGSEAVALRPFNVYGPRQSPEGGAVIAAFLRAARTGEKPVVHGDGEQTRDFVYVGDVVEAFERAATAAGVSGEAINVASGTGLTINGLLAALGDVLETPLAATYADVRPGDVRASFADTAKMGRLLGFRPRVTLAQGLLATAEWMGRSP